MDEQTSWKGHSFTLLIFTGIVVLCSIFFILGMLVGRTQGQKIAAIAAAEAAAKSRVISQTGEDKRGEKPELTFFDSLQKNEPRPLEPPPPPANVINFQIGAFRKSSDAGKLLDEVKKKGFRGFILAPPPGDANPFYRVQVGPYAEEREAEAVEQQLESAGYQPLKK